MKQFSIILLFVFVKAAFADDFDPYYLQHTQVYQKMSTQQLQVERSKLRNEIADLATKRSILGESKGWLGLAVDPLSDIPRVVRGELAPPIPDTASTGLLGWKIEKVLMRLGFHKEEYNYFLMTQKLDSDAANALDEKFVYGLKEDVVQESAVRDELCRRHAMSFESLSCTNALMTSLPASGLLHH